MARILEIVSEARCIQLDLVSGGVVEVAAFGDRQGDDAQCQVRQLSQDPFRAVRGEEVIDDGSNDPGLMGSVGMTYQDGVRPVLGVHPSTTRRPCGSRRTPQILQDRADSSWESRASRWTAWCARWNPPTPMWIIPTVTFSRASPGRWVAGLARASVVEPSAAMWPPYCYTK